MAFTEAKKRANEKYLKEKLEGITFRVPKGMKAVIQEHAKKKGESMNAFILRAVKTMIDQEPK